MNPSKKRTLSKVISQELFKRSILDKRDIERIVREILESYGN